MWVKSVAVAAAGMPLKIRGLIIYNAGIPRSHLPVIILPENPAPAERTAVKILQKQISGVLDTSMSATNLHGMKVRVLEKNLCPNDIFNAKFILSIGRWPMIWDNTLYARNLETRRYGGYTTYYPGKVRMCNLFEPYHTYMPKDFHRYNHGSRKKGAAES